MGTCCNAHLATKIRDYAKNAQNNAVTVTIIENPQIIWKPLPNPEGKQTVPEMTGHCDYCKAPAEFTCSYYSKESKA